MVKLELETEEAVILATALKAFGNLMEKHKSHLTIVNHDLPILRQLEQKVRQALVAR